MYKTYKLYKVLSLTNKATRAEILHRYQKMIYPLIHRNKIDEMIELHNVKNILTDDKKRSYYDMFGDEVLDRLLSVSGGVVYPALYSKKNIRLFFIMTGLLGISMSLQYFLSVIYSGFVYPTMIPYLFSLFPLAILVWNMSNLDGLGLVEMYKYKCLLYYVMVGICEIAIMILRYDGVISRYWLFAILVIICEFFSMSYGFKYWMEVYKDYDIIGYSFLFRTFGVLITIAIPTGYWYLFIWAIPLSHIKMGYFYPIFTSCILLYNILFMKVFGYNFNTIAIILSYIQLFCTIAVTIVYYKKVTAPTTITYLELPEKNITTQHAILEMECLETL